MIINNIEILYLLYDNIQLFNLLCFQIIKILLGNLLKIIRLNFNHLMKNKLKTKKKVILELINFYIIY